MNFLHSTLPGRRHPRVGMSRRVSAGAISGVDLPVAAVSVSAQADLDTEPPADWLANAAPIDELEFVPTGNSALDGFYVFDAPAETPAPTTSAKGKARKPRANKPADATKYAAPAGGPAVRTQTTAAEHLVRSKGKDIHWRPDAREWLRWNGRVWAPDRTGEITRDALTAIRTHFAGAASRQIAESEKQCFLNAVAGPRGGIAAALMKKKGDPVAVMAHELDTHHDLLPVANGYLHLPTGALRRASRALKMTKASPVKFSPTAKCPTWEKFIDDVACQDKELVRWLQVYLGHTLSGRISQTIAWLHGPGGNGKGVMIRMLEEILGSFATATKTDTFMESRYGSDGRAASPEVAKLQGARLVTASEGNDGAYLDAALVKWLTGGDRITARYLNANPITFDPTHKIIISTNHEPSLRSAESAMKRRVKIVPTRARFVEDGSGEKIAPPSFKSEDELRAEFPGILRWLVEGCKAWYAAGAKAGAFPTCQAIEDETARYFQNQDSIGAFILDVCNTAVNQDAKERGGDLYSQYNLWCEQNAVRPVSGTKFGRDLEARGHKQIRSNGIWRTGILIRSDRKLSRH